MNVILPYFQRRGQVRRFRPTVGGARRGPVGLRFVDRASEGLAHQPSGDRGRGALLTGIPASPEGQVSQWLCTSTNRVGRGPNPSQPERNVSFSGARATAFTSLLVT